MFTFIRFWLQAKSPVASHMSSHPRSSDNRFRLSVSCFMIWQYTSSRRISCTRNNRFLGFINSSVAHRKGRNPLLLNKFPFEPRVFCSAQSIDLLHCSRTVSRSRIHECTILLRFLGIILRVFRPEVFVHNVYITNQFQTTFAQGGGGSKIWKFCPNYVQEFSLFLHVP